MLNNIKQFFKRFKRSEKEESKSTAKERLHLVLAQDRANISADFLEMMKQEILEVIKKYIDIDEKAIDVRLTNKEGEDGQVGAPALYANIPIITIKNDARKLEGTLKKENEEKRAKEEENKVKETEESQDNNDEKNDINAEQEHEISETEKQNANNVVENENNSTNNGAEDINDSEDEAEKVDLDEDDNEEKNS